MPLVDVAPDRRLKASLTSGVLRRYVKQREVVDLNTVAEVFSARAARENRAAAISSARKFLAAVSHARDDRHGVLPRRKARDPANAGQRKVLRLSPQRAASLAARLPHIHHWGTAGRVLSRTAVAFLRAVYADEFTCISTIDRAYVY
jgi:hypothetical protein